MVDMFFPKLFKKSNKNKKVLGFLCQPCDLLTLFAYELKGDKTMLKRTFKYVDYDGNPREEDIYFHLTKTELVELSMSVPGGIAAWIRKIASAQDTKEIYNILRKIILKCYGEKSLDGRRFVKSDEISEAFAQTPMFDELFQELAFDESKMAAFIDAVTPDDNRERGAIIDFTPGPLPADPTPAN